MEVDYLAVRNAEKQVQAYADEFQGVIERHAETGDCHDCEAFLQMGIDAFDWLMRADRAIRMAIYRGEIEYSPKSEETLRDLAKQWLVPCEFAEQWMEMQLTRGFEIENLAQFRHCVAEMTAMVDANHGDNTSLPQGIAQFRDAAITEHRDGQTAEFI